MLNMEVELINITNHGVRPREGYADVKCEKCGGSKVKAGDYQDEKCSWIFYSCEDCGHEWREDDYDDLMGSYGYPG